MSETDFLKLKKHDNVETNTEKFDIENYLNGNWDKINKNAKEVNTEISNINSNNTELEKELKEAQEDFYQNSIRGQASGEYIHVEDSSNCRAKIGIGGNHEQETRSGKNKLACPANFEETTLGIKVKQNNGIYSITGTTTSAGTCMTEKTIDNYTIESGDYLHLNNNVIENRVAFVFVFTDGTVDSTSLVKINRICNLENKVGKTISKVKIYCNTKDVNLSFEIKPMICKDSAVTDFEQHGASPSPNYLSEIKTVGSNVNLFDKDNMTIGKIWNGATLLDSDVGNASPKIPVTAGKTYIRNAGYSSNYIIKENNSVVDVQGGTNAITMPEDAKYWMFNIPKDIDINTIKAEEGSISTPQSKYGQGSVKVTKCNKNLLDSSILENKILDSKTGSATTNTSWKASDFIQINSGIYNFSWKSSSNYFQVTICFYDRNKNFLSGISWAIANVYSKSFEVDENTTFIRVSYSTIISGKEANREKIILEQNSTETDYEQHEEQSYIMPVQKEMLEGDYVADVEHHEWKKLTLTGNENIKLNTAFANVFNIEIPKINIMNQQVCLCNIAKGVVYNTALLTIQNNIIMTASLNKIVYKSTKFSSLSEFKTYLQNQYEEGTPVIVYYKLAEPINLELTDEQKAVAKDLNNARTYKNVTNITTDSKAILSLDYTKDLETLLTSKESEV